MEDDLNDLSMAELRSRMEGYLEQIRIERAAKGPRPWTSWLPAAQEARALAAGAAWPTNVFASFLEIPKKQDPVSDDELKALDKFVEGPVEVKRQRVEGVSSEATQAVQALWAMDFGIEWANPFRMRLTREACDAFGMHDYFDVVPDPMDLDLIRQKLERKEYAADADVRADVALIGANAARYHTRDSPLVSFADDLLRTFDAKLMAAGLRVG